MVVFYHPFKLLVLSVFFYHMLWFHDMIKVTTYKGKQKLYPKPSPYIHKKKTKKKLNQHHKLSQKTTSTTYNPLLLHKSKQQRQEAAQQPTIFEKQPITITIETTTITFATTTINDTITKESLDMILNIYFGLLHKIRESLDLLDFIWKIDTKGRIHRIA